MVNFCNLPIKKKAKLEILFLKSIAIWKLLWPNFVLQLVKITSIL